MEEAPMAVADGLHSSLASRTLNCSLPRLPSPGGFACMRTSELRGCFLIERLFQAEQVRIFHTDLDRACVGGAVPVSSVLSLEASPEIGSEYFAQRRELGVFNIGDPGVVRVGTAAYHLEARDALYIPRGSREIEFESEAPESPPMFYFVSYPAHVSFEPRLVRAAETEAAALGSVASSNRRTIRKYLCPPCVETCQLTMGLTELEEGSIWNTMPAHLHPRRSEIYLYFDMSMGQAVFHLMGGPQETRHVVVRNRQAVLSPAWSIHSGAGTASYSFIWSMGGENREFSDMDGIPVEDLA